MTEPGAERVEHRLAAILAADVVAYSRSMAADEAGTLRRLKRILGEIVEPMVAAYQGRIVKTTGDGLLVQFDSAIDAVTCAAAWQDAVSTRQAGMPQAERLVFRIGANLGDVIVDGGDVFGDGVNVAARLEGLAEPGGILISASLHDQVIGKADLAFADEGEQALKNMPRPVRAYRVVGAARPKGGGGAQPSLPDRPSIAVLSFQNMSGDAEQEYFADGIVEDIITALSRFKELFVIARNSSFIYKGKAVDIQQVARELGVRYVLEGSVRKAGNRVRMTGQLIDTATRAHLWADKFDGAFEDVFELQDRITESVVGALAPSLQKAEIERSRRKPPANLDAYDYVLRAQAHIMANTQGDAAQAFQYLEKALALDPDYAFAHALLCNAHGQIFRAASGDERIAAQQGAERHARRALALGADDGAVLTFAGWVLLITVPDVAAGRAALDRAVQLNPNLAVALVYRGIALAITGEPEAAIQEARKALRLNPLDPNAYLAWSGIVVAQVDLGHYDEAALASRKVIEGNPRFPMGYAWAIVAECRRGDGAEAEALLNRLFATMPGFKREALPALFSYFPPAIRDKVLGLLRGQGLVA
ncbi:MAG: adenylate/guanylate cyclase domain-containing protein [Stellaceae bacterium]